MSSKVKKVRLELDFHKKSSDGFEMFLSITQQLVTCLCNNDLSYDPETLVNSLKASSSGSHKIFHSKAQEIEDALHCLKEECRPHKHLLKCLENLNSTMNYKCTDAILLIALIR